MKYIFFATLIIILSCKTNKNLVVPIESDDMFIDLDTLVVNANEEESADIQYPYRSTETRKFDLLHTRLYISFDWKNQYALGKAVLDLKPYARPQEELILDAKTMEIKAVVNARTGSPLPYRYNNAQLTIQLGQSYGKKDSLRIVIDYIAKPNTGVEKGSDAILSDKGLFFINPLQQDKDKPQQIWTQGETENNSKWFPTIDKPNERCSQEIYITVEDKFSTLSNGKLMTSVKNADGTRTDYWKQEKPHAPYLFMMAIGEYAWVEDKWKDLPLYYLVEKPYAPYAKQIFNHTPEMLNFFETAFKYPYPWDKYAQVVTRDYVSGAMENTGAVVFGEFVQKTDRELIDDDNDAIVAHEMSHHWFGDLVTCESWSNLTLNEGFANYAEYLWKEFKYGEMNADEHRLNEIFGYLSSTMNGQIHPLIHYHYSDKEAMFDAHSYNKGGLVLHHLRGYLGDEVFFESLNKYLKDNAYTAVEADQLRLAFEAVSGEDLNWFFDQWYFRQGHPMINVDYNYNEQTKQLTIITNQDSTNIFKVPLQLASYDEMGKVNYYPVLVQNVIDTQFIQMDRKPYVLSFDGKDEVVGVVYENKSEEQWLQSFIISRQFMDKFKAFQNISVESPLMKELVSIAINDEYYYFRDLALQYLAELPDQLASYKEIILDKSLNDAHSKVRQSALQLLGSMDVLDKTGHLEKIIAREKAYIVQSAALIQLNEIDKAKALQNAKVLSAENNATLDNAIAMVFANQSDPQYHSWFRDKVKKHEVNSAFEMFGFYNIYLLNQNSENVRSAVDLYTSLGLDRTVNRYRRFIATASLVSLKNMLLSHEGQNSMDKGAIVKKIEEAIHDIKVAETDEELITRYSEF